ncbi:MAG TPA: pitrilysin family protein [Syntrophales bacterium]|nr:pitrilysin family protein [Syntrophales bacterium]
MHKFIYRVLHFVLLYFLLSSTIACAAETTSISQLPDPDKLQYQLDKFILPQAQRVVIDNGIILYIFEDHELPIINISAVIRTGSNYDTIGQEGLAELTATAMRTGGTNSMSASAVDEALDFFAGSISVSMNRDSGSFNLSVMKKDLDEGLNIFSQVLTNPAFEQNKISLAKDLKIEELRRIADDPEKLAFREFKKLLYDNNPAGRFPTLASVKNIQRDDLVQFYNSFFYPGNLMIAVTGDISKQEAVNKIKEHFGAWNKANKHHDIPPIPVKQKGHIYFLFKDIPQSVIIYAQFAPGKKNPDAYPFDLLDFIVGSGGFRSLIFREVRNNLGLAYSTGSFYTKKSEYGVFGAYAITKSESTAEVLSLIRSIIKDLSNSMIDKKDIERAIKSINNNFVFSFLSAKQIAYQQLIIEYEHLPEDYLATYRDRIAQVKAEDLKKMAVKYLSTDEPVTLVVGNENAYKQMLTTFRNVSRIESKL